MIRLAAVIATFAADLRAQSGHRLASEHTRALAAMQHCRTQASPKMQVQCTGCEHQMLVPHSCGHRHCPHCQHHERQQWLERQLQKQVPAEYFLLTFTLPARIPGAVYLGRYLYRGVISENDILACADGQMSFRYRDGKIGKTERRTVSGADFLWLVPQHVLPKGFRRARNFGFLHPNVKLCGARSASEPA